MLPDKTYQAICVQVVRLLREERERRKLSRYAVAKRSGVTEQMIGYVERGMRSPSLETTLRMAFALEIDLGRVIRRAYTAVRKQKAK